METETYWQKSEDLDPKDRDGDNWKLVEVFLSGGAPWGFTLRGGLEHREPLLITKVEEGSKAAAVNLQVGDELVNINEIPLSGYRQEAICLVKGSHKTLSLAVKRRNEPISRPHSWHSTKFNESQSEAAKTHSPPGTVWHTRYDASASSTDLSSGWEPTNLRRVSDQFSSHGSMDSLEHVSHPYPAGQLSPAKSNNSMEHLGGGGGGGGKRDSAYSSFSTSSGTPDYTLSKSNTASTENVFHKFSQWDSGGKQSSSSRSNQNVTEGVKQDDRAVCSQVSGGVSGWEAQQAEEAGHRHSTSSRTSLGPVWHVPEKKKPSSSSPPPPPPPPPARSDSFAATKVHERGLLITPPEGPETQGYAEGRRSYNPSAKSDDNNCHNSYDKSNLKQFNSNKHFSLSSGDVRQAPPPQQRHHSDKSTFYSQPWAAATPAPKPQNVAGYYCSLQELPINGSGQHAAHNQRRNFNTSPPTAESSSGQSRYYCVTTCQLTQPNPHAGKACEDRPQSGSEQSSVGPHTQVTKAKYHLQQQGKDSNGYTKQHVTTTLETFVPKFIPDDKARGVQCADSQVISYASSRVPEQQQRRSLPVQQQAQQREFPPDSRHHHSHLSTRISPQETPLLHSLSLDATGQDARLGQSVDESPEGKPVRRSDRFATTLRNEIQMRKARLQKSPSATALPGESDEELDTWKSAENSTPTSANGSFTNTYKVNLKEAQTRVLMATSFRRKDLEPVLLEHPSAEALASYPSAAQMGKDASESGLGKMGQAGGLVPRIGGRKRFQAEKKVRSFSEPDKINEVGVKGVLPENHSSSLDQDRQAESAKPPSSSHISPRSYAKNPAEAKTTSPGANSQAQGSNKGVRGGKEQALQSEQLQGGVFSGRKPSAQDQLRLGTFAEYEATWNTQEKKSETRGRYRSVDDILDPGPEERSKAKCFHERSRSSPSADFYAQKIQVPARRSEPEYFQTESKPAERLVTATRFSDRVREKPNVDSPERYPPAPPSTGANPESRQRAAPAVANHRAPSVSHEEQAGSQSQSQSGPRSKTSAPEKPPPPPSCPEVDSHESPSGRQSETFFASAGSAFASAHPGQSEQVNRAAVREDGGQGAVQHPSASSRQPASLSPPLPPPPPAPASSYTAMEGQRSPSPHFSPQRLSDEPPFAAKHEESNGMDHVTGSQAAAAKTVPVRIIHSEEATEDKCPFLQRNNVAAAAPEPRGLATTGLGGTAGLDSPFCAFTPQGKDEDAPPAPHFDPTTQRDVYMSTGRDHINGCSQQPLPLPQPTGQPAAGSCRMTTTGTAGLAEEQKREELARDIMGKDRSLADILDQSKMKTTMDLMEGIFPQGEQLLEGAQQRRKLPAKQAVARPSEAREKEDSMAAAVGMVANSAYYSTSAPKAELLIKMKDMQEQEVEEEDSEEELDIDLANKKQELIDSLSKKLQVLREARESLQEDILDNNALGDEVEAQVQQVCKPNELDKFRMFVGDLDKVVSLLLSLSGRLARVENALNTLEEDATADERRTLVEKRKLLIRQHEDAKELKENLDRRERVVYDILSSYLPEDTLTDYEHFVKMKSALIIEQRKLEDKIKLGDEQLKCLMDSLPVEQRLVL